MQGYGRALLPAAVWVAAYAAEQNWQMEAVLNNDMIGNIAGINGVIDNRSVRIFSEGVRHVETTEEARNRYFQGAEVDSASRNLARRMKVLGASPARRG